MDFLLKVAHADTTTNTTVNNLVAGIVTNIVTPLVEGIFALALVLFIWGLMGFIFGGEDATKKAEGKQHILWGIVGMVIMVSVYGIIRFVANSLGQGSVLTNFGY